MTSKQLHDRRRSERPLQAGGPDKPNIGRLSDEFLKDVRATPLKNLAVELLERMLKDGDSLQHPNKSGARKEV